MMGRMLKALARRAGEGDLLSLEELAALERAVSAALVEAGRAAHDGDAAYSWAEIAGAIGITRQAAHKRFGGNR